MTEQVFTHTDPFDPRSGLGVQLGSTLTYQPAALAGRNDEPGPERYCGQAVSAAVDRSVTNFNRRRR